MSKKRKVRRANILIILTFSIFMMVLFVYVTEDKDKLQGIDIEYMNNEKGAIPLSVDELFNYSINKNCINTKNIKCLEILEKYEEERLIFLKTNDML